MTVSRIGYWPHAFAAGVACSELNSSAAARGARVLERDPHRGDVPLYLAEANARPRFCRQATESISISRRQGVEMRTGQIKVACGQQIDQAGT